MREHDGQHAVGPQDPLRLGKGFGHQAFVMFLRLLFRVLGLKAVVSRRHFFFVAPNWRHVTGTMMAALGWLTRLCRRAALTIRLCLMPRRRFFPRSPR